VTVVPSREGDIDVAVTVDVTDVAVDDAVAVSRAAASKTDGCAFRESQVSSTAGEIDASGSLAALVTGECPGE
jgi:hypothetical protein